jgi:ketosteroid isomerase-like protein
MNTAQQTDAQIMQAAYEAFRAGDIPAVLAVIDENATWHVPGASLISGDYQGHDEILGFFMKLVELSSGTLQLDVHEIFDNGTGTVVALAAINASRNGEDGSFASAQVWSLAGGKITSYKEHYGDEAAMNAFWS